MSVVIDQSRIGLTVEDDGVTLKVEGVTQGPSGPPGWSPLFAVVSDGSRRVLQVADWTGGGGTKPTTGQYLGAAGLVSNIANAVDIRGPSGSGDGGNDLAIGTTAITGGTANYFLTTGADGKTLGQISQSSFVLSNDFSVLFQDTAENLLGTAAFANTDAFAAASHSHTPSVFGSQTKLRVLASPAGADGNPAFRALEVADIPTLNQSTTGNAATATKLATARLINGVSFDGSANITITAAPTAHTHGPITNDGKIGSDGVLAVLEFWDSEYDSYGANVNYSNGEYQFSDHKGDLATIYGLIGSTYISDATTVGRNLLTLTNPGSVGFTRTNADNTTTHRTPAEVRTDLGLGDSATRNVGTSAGTVAAGDDSRLSDARTPTAHNQAWSTITGTPTTLAGYGITDGITSAAVVAGYQPLDSDLTAIASLTTTTFGRSLLTQADAAATRATLGLNVTAGTGYFSAPTNSTVVLIAKASFAVTLSQIRGLKTSAGTCTVTVQINGTNVTGLSSLSVTSTAQDATATAANSVAIGDRVTLIVASVSSAADLEFTLQATR